MSTLAVPAGGTWQLCDALSYCVVCERFVPRAWRYFTEAVSHASVCEGCAPNVKEEDDAVRGGPATSR